MIRLPLPLAAMAVLALAAPLPACSFLTAGPVDEDDDEERDPPDGDDDPPPLPDCDEPSDCEEGAICVDGSCHVGCSVDEECRGFYRACDVAVGACVECTDAADCDAGDQCVDRACETPIENSCVPNEVGCVDDSTAFVCNADGTARTEAPCRDDQLCREGACVLLVCTPGRDECTGNSLVQCSADGTQSTVTACDDPAVCDAALGCACVDDACVARACEPLSGRCVGNSAQRCDEQGTAFGALSDCGAELCVEGLCLDDACTPGDGFCSGTALVQCQSDGVGYDRIECPETCSGLPGSAACSNQVCVPASQVCDGNSLIVCNATGTQESTVPCSSNQFCAFGACQNQVCAPNSRSCVGDDVLVCNAQGSGVSQQNCGDTETCANGVCIEESCVPNCSGRECGLDPVCGTSCGPCNGLCTLLGQCEAISGPELQVTVSWSAAGIDGDAYLTRGGTSMCDAETCYWANCLAQSDRPDWDGTPGNSPLDPLLDVDNVDTANPELLRVTLPSVPQVYRAGAHLFKGNASGTSSTVFVDVFIDNALVQTFSRPLFAQDMWDGVTIQWNGVAITSVQDSGSIVPDFECGQNPPDGCAADAECPDGQICLSDGGFLGATFICREGCRDDDDCVGTAVCNGAFACGPAGSVVGWKAPCSGDANCEAGFDCGFFSQVCEESCVPGCTPGVDCCELSGGDVCEPDAFFGDFFASCAP